MITSSPAEPRILITGGAGFLGSHLLRELEQRGPALGLRPREIRVLDRAAERLPAANGVRPISGDIRSEADLRTACAGVDLVFHCAALVDWGQHRPEEIHAINVEGTQQVLRACAEAGVRAVVHTSTMDVVYSGRPVRGADETAPYPRRFASAYCSTKATGEQLALRANGGWRAPREDGDDAPLRTVVVRPCGMFGEGDPFHLPPLLRMAQQGLLLRVGNGRARFQHVYVGNVAYLHLLAGQALLGGRDEVAGQVYLATDFPANNFFDHMEPLVRGVGYRMQPWRRSLPRPLMLGLGLALEGAAGLLRPWRRLTPAVTRFSVNLVCQDFTFETDKAARELGYAPVYDEKQALARTVAYFREYSPR